MYLNLFSVWRKNSRTSWRSRNVTTDITLCPHLPLKETELPAGNVILLEKNHNATHSHIISGMQKAIIDQSLVTDQNLLFPDHLQLTGDLLENPLTGSHPIVIIPDPVLENLPVIENCQLPDTACCPEARTYNDRIRYNIRRRNSVNCIFFLLYFS